MNEPPPIYQITNGIYQDVDLTAVPDIAELSRALRGIVMAGKALEDVMGVPLDQRQVITKDIRRQLEAQ